LRASPWEVKVPSLRRTREDRNLSRVRQQARVRDRTAQIQSARSVFNISLLFFADTLTRVLRYVHVSFLKCLENVNSERARQLQLHAGAAGIACAPHNRLAFSTQLRLCSKNGSFLSWDTLEHAPSFRSAKSARTLKLCGHINTTCIPERRYLACSHGGA
jgi:hypothetical protein